MNDAVLNVQKVSLSRQVPFHCKGCAVCCQHVKQSVALESLDVFRITKHLRDRGDKIQCPDDFLEQYAEPALLDQCGFFIMMLKVQGSEDSCIFLENNRCTIHTAKPRACRIYPFIAGPKEEGGFEYLVSLEHPHHFTGKPVKVKHWMNRYFLPEERDFLQFDYHAVPRIASLMRKIPEKDLPRAMTKFWWYRYSAYNLDKPFMEQFPVNMEKLQIELRKMASSNELFLK